jgi:hypothetical protein
MCLVLCVFMSGWLQFWWEFTHFSLHDVFIIGLKFLKIPYTV